MDHAPRELGWEDLPKLLRVERGLLVCGGCRRRWRLPPDGRLSYANFNWLVEHAITHQRVHWRRKPQRWRPS